MQSVALLLSKKAVWQEITLGEFIEANRRIQFNAESFSLSLRALIFICLIATKSSYEFLFFALTTRPKLPLPSSLNISYYSMEELQLLPIENHKLNFDIFRFIFRESVHFQDLTQQRKKKNEQVQSFNFIRILIAIQSKLNYVSFLFFLWSNLSNTKYFQQQEMLKRKNYKEQQHFTRYFSVFVPRSNGTKFTLYFKRYKPPQQQVSLFDLLHNKTPKQEVIKSPYPLDRTLEVISFDGRLQIAVPYFKKIGKVRKVVMGETKFGERQMHYSIIIFKYEFDLVKCFREEFFQEVINRQNKQGAANEEDKEEYKSKIIAEYMGQEIKELGKLQELKKQGYNVITNALGEFKFDYEANQKSIQDLPQIRRKKKLEQKQKQRQRRHQQ